MSFELIIIFILFSLLLIVAFFQFFFSNNNTGQRLKILVEKQENLEKSLQELIEKNFDKIDTKFEKSSSENNNNLHKIRERITLIDRAQQNITGLTENVVDLKNILSNTAKRGRLGEILLEQLIKDYLPKKIMNFIRHCQILSELIA